ncbi:MAG: family 78 glycoside hydrolase catalytic domain [Promethearchaeota archaeon]
MIAVKKTWNPTTKWIWVDYITPWTTQQEFRAFRVVGVREDEKNRYALFRRTFDLPSDFVPGEGRSRLSITVDGRYKLFINGSYVGRGIYRCDKFNWYCDEYEVDRFLRPGRNAICVVARFFGESMAWYEPYPNSGLTGRNLGKGGLMFECTVASPQRVLACVHSDAGTRARACDAWERDTPQAYFGLPRVEVFHAALYPGGWLEPDFDDSGPEWDHCLELDKTSLQPRMVVCDIPRLQEERVLARRLVGAGPVEPFFDEEDIRESMEPGEEPIDFFLQLGLSKFSGVDAELVEGWSGEWPLRVDLDGVRPRGFVFDLGRTTSGFPFFEVETDLEGVVVSLGWSEKLEPDPGNPMPKYFPYKLKMGLQVHCGTGTTEYEAFQWYGFRYLQVNVEAPRGVSGRVWLKAAGVNQYLYPVEPVGTFKCDDAGLNELFETCRWTLRNCMHDGYEDCPSREQRQWVGDAYVEVLANFRLFGDTALAAKLLRQVAQSLRGDGLTQLATPGDWELHGTTIPDYTLYWISTLHEYYWYTGDAGLVEALFPRVLEAVKWFLEYVDPNTGLLSGLPYWIFVDWSENDKWGSPCHVNAQFHGVLEQVVFLGREIGWDGAVGRLEGTARRLADGINRYLWDEPRGAYVDAVVVAPDGVTIERWSTKLTFHSNALVVLHGIAPPDRVPRILENVFDLPYGKMFVKSQDPLWTGCTVPAREFDEKEHVVMAEPFFMHNVNQALARAGRHDLVLRYIRDGWLGMLERGATTLWESWSDANSLCHAWSTTPAYDLSTHVLGVKLAQPGATKVVVEPHPCDLSWAEGTVPTVNGPVWVRWEWGAYGREFSLQYKAPDGISVECDPPRVGGERPREVVDEPAESGGSGRKITYRYS